MFLLFLTEDRCHSLFRKTYKQPNFGGSVIADQSAEAQANDEIGNARLIMMQF